MEDLWGFFACVGFVFFAVPLVLCIALWAKFGALTRRIAQLEVRVNDLLRLSVQRQSQPAAVQPPAPAPAPSPAGAPAPMMAEPVMPATMPSFLRVAPAPRPALPPRPPVPPVVPAARPQRAGGTEKGVEAYFATKLLVVLAAVTLGMAGIFLVQVGIEHGLLRPEVRIWAGIIAGLAMLGVAQWRRMYEGFIAQGLAAAGIVALFAAIFAATTLFHFIPAVAGFVLLACVTAAAVAMSLQNWSGHGGVLIAALGLIGGFVTPILVNTGQRNAPGLFGYLLLLHIGLLTTTRMRGWTILAALSMLFSCLWLAAWLAMWPWMPGEGALLGAFMLASVAATIAGTANQPEKWHGNAAARILTWLAGAAGVVMGCLLLGSSGYSDVQWAFFAVLLAGAFVMGRWRNGYEGLAWVAGFAALGMLATWGIGEHPWAASGDFGLPTWKWLPPHPARLTQWLAGFGIASSLAAYVCLWKSRSPVRWAGLCVLLALGYVGTAYWVLATEPRAVQWAYLPLIAGAVLTALALPVGLRRARMVMGEDTLAVLATGVAAMLFIAAPMAWDASALTAAWCALLILVAAAIWGLRMPGLLVGFAGVLVAVIIRGLDAPAWMQAGGEGRMLFWNPVVWTYGSCMAGMILAAEFLKRSAPVPEKWRGSQPSPVTMAGICRALAIVASFALLTLEVRWYFHDGKMDQDALGFVERGTYAVAWFVMAGALLAAGYGIPAKIARLAGLLIAWAGLTWAVIICAVIANPLWGHEAVGTMRIFNALLYVFGLPALAAGILAWKLPRRTESEKTLAQAAAVAGLFLIWILVTLEVQQWFRGPMLDLGPGPFGEMTAYSLAWALLGGIYLAAGIALKSPAFRWGSLAMMMITVAKVFIWDLADLKDMERVLSFAGLGVSLMAIAFVYQRFVFRKAPPAESAVAGVQ